MKIVISYITILAAVLYGCTTESSRYQITMNRNYMETNFPLINGLQIDELQVTSFSKENIPYEFYLKETFVLRKREDTSRHRFMDNVIFFDRPNINYCWQNDSVWGIYNISVSDYHYRGSVSKKDRWDSSYQRLYDVYPRSFKRDTWYLIDFRPSQASEQHHAFMYVDNDGKFTFYELKEVGEH